jgi:hypothetical protein
MSLVLQTRRVDNVSIQDLIIGDATITAWITGLVAAGTIAGSAAAPRPALSTDATSGVFNDGGFPAISVSGVKRARWDTTQTLFNKKIRIDDAGTSALPAISNSSDNTTGIFFPGAGRMGVDISGFQLFEFNVNGISAPSGTLANAGLGFIVDPSTGFVLNGTGDFLAVCHGSQVAEFKSTGISFGIQLTGTDAVFTSTCSVAGFTVNRIFRTTIIPTGNNPSGVTCTFPNGLGYGEAAAAGATYLVSIHRTDNQFTAIPQVQGLWYVASSSYGAGTFYQNTIYSSAAVLTVIGGVGSTTLSWALTGSFGAGIQHTVSVTLVG